MSSDNEKWYLYTHTTPDDHIYVGQTKNPQSRWYESAYRNNSLGKYLSDNHYDWIDVDSCIEMEFDNEEEARKAEGALIDFLKPSGKLINTSRSGEFAKNYPELYNKYMWVLNRDSYNEHRHNKQDVICNSQIALF